ncbi:hypothetical protein BGZ88_002435, partial [Linnemannia elongata]
MEREQETNTIDVTSFGDLPPEVQVMVARYLTQHDLAVCLRVCHAWKKLYHPRLWEHIDIYWDKKETQRVAVSRALKANGHLIHSLKFRSEVYCVLEDFLLFCPPKFQQLTSVEFDCSLEFVNDPDIAQLLDMSSKKWRLVFWESVRSKLGIEFSRKSFERLLKHADTLEIFHIESRNSVEHEYIHRLLCTAPRLKELSSLETTRRLLEASWMHARLYNRNGSARIWKSFIAAS